MKILGIDTSTKFLCIGLYNNGKLYEYNLEVSRQLSSLLTLTIKRVLDAAGLQINEIDYFACGLGPGSFTGVRIGLASIKGFAWVLKKPLLGISTLDILAKNANVEEAITVIPAIDAKRNLVYCSGYRIGKNNLKRIMPYMLLSENEFLKKVKPKNVILGDALNLYKENILKSVKRVTVLDKDYWYPQARHIIALAQELIKNKKINNSYNIKPVYLYPKECQIKKCRVFPSSNN